MATILNIYDYTVIDPYWGFEEQFVIGYGDLSAEAINAKIDAAEGDLDIHINSQGGKVFDGWAIYNKLKSYDKGKVSVYVDGIAASIASIIAMAGETVTMMQASMMMIHKPTGFYLGAMDADELASEAQSLTEIESVLIDIYATKTGLSTTKLQNLLDATTWLSPDSALALGFCDNVMKAEKKPVIPENVFNRLFENSNDSIRTYVNTAFEIKQNNNMSTVTVKDIAEKQEKTNSLLTDFLNLFKGDKKNEVTEDKSTEVVEEKQPESEGEETFESLKKKNADLEAQIAADKDKIDNAQSILDKANEMYSKMESTLAEVKSNYKPASPSAQFRSSDSKDEPKSRFSHLQNN